MDKENKSSYLLLLSPRWWGCYNQQDLGIPKWVCACVCVCLCICVCLWLCVCVCVSMWWWGCCDLSKGLGIPKGMWVRQRERERECVCEGCVCVCTLQAPPHPEEACPHSPTQQSPYQACFPLLPFIAHCTLTRLQSGLVDGLSSTHRAGLFHLLHTQSPAQMPSSEQVTVSNQTNKCLTVKCQEVPEQWWL